MKLNFDKPEFDTSVSIAYTECLSRWSRRYVHKP